jgi:hypothetical protein
VLPWELTVPVQVLFASLGEDGLVVDCTVAEEVVTADSVRIPPGSPFSLVIDHQEPGAVAPVGHRGADEVLSLLERWCSAGVVVQATTSSADRCLVLCHDRDQVVLEIV